MDTATPEPVEQPIRRDYQTRITKETAMKMVARRAELKAQRLANPPALALTGPSQPVLDAHLTADERDELIRGYKELAAQSMANLKILTDPKDRHQEASTLAKLNVALWRYAQVHGEGTLKPVQPKQKDSRFDGLPVRPL